MNLFYELLLWATRWEIDFGRATGLNPRALAALKKDEAAYELALTRRLINF